jgi:hypothetical protein
MGGREMTNEQINIAIAEACGWKEEEFGPSWYQSYTKMPDYCNDLNAMHEAEKVLNERQRQTYAWQIIRLARKQAGIEDYESHYPVPFVLFATAEQRAEAFLRTLNLWEE